MTADPHLVSEEHWAQKGDVSLFVARKRLRERSADQRQRLPVILVHGSSNSALPTFDLTVPGHPDYSLMDWLALRGWDVWAMDHEGYGRSTVTSGNSDIATSVEDLKAMGNVITAETGTTAFNLYGLSSGSLRVAAFAQSAPDRAARIVLDAFVWTGEGSPTLEKRKEGVAQFRASNRRAIDLDYLVGIFLRDGPGTTHPAVAEACALAQLKYDNSVPTGTYLDMTTKLPLVDPAKISSPTFVVRGEHDSLATMSDLLAFFDRLSTNDKRFAVLPHLAHVATLGKNRHVLWNAVDEFFQAGFVSHR
ncbi:MAG: alpha/beta fold hydrolase [Afipia sp.]|nr:alpha/beta fold hydrolase [Afipia sp.]